MTTKEMSTTNRAQHQWERIYRHLGITSVPVGEHGPCPLCQAPSGFVLINRVRGKWQCGSCGASGAGVGLVAQVLGIKQSEASERISVALDALGVSRYAGNTEQADQEGAPLAGDPACKENAAPISIEDGNRQRPRIRPQSVTPRLDISAITEAATGQWESILPALGIKVPKRGRHGSCPVCGGEDRFHFDDKEDKGTWYCRQCDGKNYGDGLDLVVKVTGKSNKEAAQEVAQVLGLVSGALDDEVIRQRQAQAARRAEQEKAQEQARRKQAASYAAELVSQGLHSAGAPYLVGKGLNDWSAMRLSSPVELAGTGFAAGDLLVPLHDHQGKQVNVQLINAKGEKRYLAGGQKAGAFHRIEGGELVAVCEGYATGVSVHLATEATVYCAMDCGNLLAVANIARAHHPKSRIILAADNDAHTEGNPGKTKAGQAAAKVRGLVALPDEPGDWDDYRQAHGLDLTKAAFLTVNDKDGSPDASQREALPWQADPSCDTTATDELPDGYLLESDRLCALVWHGRGEEARQEKVPICSPLRVLAVTHDDQEQGYGRLLEWQTTTGQVRRWAMPMRLLSRSSGDEVIERLLDAGLTYINLSKKNLLRDYLCQCHPERRVICVERTGWHGLAYVLPREVIGPDADAVILQSAGFAGDDFTKRGTLEQWRERVSALCVGNSRLAFAVSSAFAAPLLSLVGMDGGGFHLKGESTDGKSTVMMVAASVCGGAHYHHTWRATGNALEGIASRRNDALLCLDELREVDGREAGQTAYMLANGQGKGRAKIDGELRDRKQWRLLFFSTGELSLAQHVEQAGDVVHAGMEVRMLQIPSDTGKHGAFEQLHGLSGGKELADQLRERIRHQHGTAFQAFIQAVSERQTEHTAWLKEQIRQLTATMQPKDAGNQVGRAITRFALVAAAGELATRLGVTGWPQGEAIRAAHTCLAAWLADRGHIGNQEDAASLAQVRHFFTAFQLSRFADWNDSGHRPSNLVGYRKADAEGVIFVVQSDGWKEICKGRNPEKVARLCAEAGWLQIPESGRFQSRMRLPGMMNPARVYLFTMAVLGEEASQEEDLGRPRPVIALVK